MKVFYTWILRQLKDRICVLRNSEVAVVQEIIPLKRQKFLDNLEKGK